MSSPGRQHFVIDTTLMKW